MKKLICFAIALSGALCILTGQDATIWVPKVGGIPAIAIPDFRGAGDAQKLMPAFNETLADDIRACGLFKVVAKLPLPTLVPQPPPDLEHPAPPPAPPPPRGQKQPPQPVAATTGGGRWMHDWSGPPAQ